MPFSYTDNPSVSSPNWGPTLNSILSELKSATNLNASHNHSGEFSLPGHSHDSVDGTAVVVSPTILGKSNVQLALQAILDRIDGQMGVQQTGIHFTVTGTSHTITENDILDAIGIETGAGAGVNYRMEVSLWEEDTGANPPTITACSGGIKIQKDVTADVTHLEDVEFAGLTSGDTLVAVFTVRLIDISESAYNPPSHS